MDAWPTAKRRSWRREAVRQIVTSLVSRSATEILLPYELALPVGELPTPLTELVTFVRTDAAAKGVAGLLSPVQEEFSIEVPPGGGVIFRKWSAVNRTAEPDLPLHLMSLVSGLQLFLNGMNYKAEIELDLDLLRRSIVELLRISRSNEAKAVLFRLEGLLSTYSELGLPYLGWRSSAPEGVIETFHKLVADSDYRALSESVWMIPFDRKAERYLELARRSARAVVRKPLFRPAFNVASRVVRAAIGVPTPDVDFPEAFAQSTSMPMIALPGTLTATNWAALTDAS